MGMVRCAWDTSAAEIGFVWDGDEQALPPLRMLTGPVQHFESAILEAGRSRLAPS